MTERSENDMATDEYLLAIGRAVYAFACADFAMFYVISDFYPPFGYAKEVDYPTHFSLVKTPGKFKADLLAAVAGNILPIDLKERYEKYSAEYGAISRLRNGLLHAWPFTASDTSQQIGGNYFEPALPPIQHRVEWSLDKLAEVTVRFRANEAEGGNLRTALKGFRAAPVAAPEPI